MLHRRQTHSDLVVSCEKPLAIGLPPSAGLPRSSRQLVTRLPYHGSKSGDDKPGPKSKDGKKSKKPKDTTADAFKSPSDAAAGVDALCRSEGPPLLG
ncbi:hypothetical protein AX14_009236 [Amanita brunnescens Koide BX004]|nr:hypothetical protein AX14_009236 [Amanita brunnescens Koide BX004]